MSRRIDEIKDILLAILSVIDQTGRLELDRNAPLPLQVHIVQKLSFHISVRHQSGLFDETVGESGFSMVDMSDNAEIPYIFLIRIHNRSFLFLLFAGFLKARTKKYLVFYCIIF